MLFGLTRPSVLNQNTVCVCVCVATRINRLLVNRWPKLHRHMYVRIGIHLCACAAACLCHVPFVCFSVCSLHVHACASLMIHVEIILLPKSYFKRNQIMAYLSYAGWCMSISKCLRTFFVLFTLILRTKLGMASWKQFMDHNSFSCTVLIVQTCLNLI